MTSGLRHRDAPGGAGPSVRATARRGGGASGTVGSKIYVQQIADSDPPNAVGIITSATLSVRKVATRATKVFAAVPGPVAGSVKLSTPSAGVRVSYDWQISPDGGKTWTLLPTTLQAHTLVTGLPVGAYLFRFRVVTAKGGAGDWSGTVSLTLH